MLVESRTSSGLIVREEAADHASVARALREHDDQLRLVPQAVGDELVWTVLRFEGGDRPATIVCKWFDYERGEALPLSHRLVERVKMLDRNTRGRVADEDAANRRLIEKRTAEFEEHVDDIARDGLKGMKRHPAFHRGIHLRKSGRLEGR